MAQVLQNTIFQAYHHLIDDLSDPRVKNWWLMESPGPIITILASYLFFCVYAGPQYMRDRKPYNLKNIIMVYNLFQIAMSIFLVYLTIDYLIVSNYNFQCPNIDYSNSPRGITDARNVWWYMVAKVTELLDTVFFVLRKKTNQLTFLHLYHHTVMTALAWFATKYSSGGECIIDGGLNSFIHTLMYGYYFLSALGPQYQKYLWWKKYLTTLQLIQFSIVVYLNTNCLFTKNSNYPLFINLYVLTNGVAFFYMFSNFFYRNYIKTNKRNN